jgi:hypothetical protein
MPNEHRKPLSVFLGAIQYPALLPVQGGVFKLSGNICLHLFDCLLQFPLSFGESLFVSDGIKAPVIT